MLYFLLEERDGIMGKVAVVTDSNSGITQAQGTELGIFVLPMPFMIDEEQFFEDVNLSQEQFYEKLEAGANVVTSQPSPEAVMNLWKEILTDYDEIVHIPMSSGLSGSCQSAMMLSEEFDGRVQVVNNQRISVTQKQSCMDALMLAGQGRNAAEIREILENDKFNSSIYIMLDTLFYLKKGGRITPAAAAIGTLLKLKPVLQIQGEKLDAFAKARTMKQARTLMLNSIQKELETRLGDSQCQYSHLAIAHTQNAEAAEEFRKELQEKYPSADIIVAPLSLSISCHIGPGSLAVTATRKMVEEYEVDQKQDRGILS